MTETSHERALTEDQATALRHHCRFAFETAHPRFAHALGKAIQRAEAT